jgi:glycosyltransferase involved in cell wall biosynthesis
MKRGKISVLEVIDDASMGGGQVHVLMLAKYLNRQLFDIRVACEPNGFLADELRKIEVDVLPVKMDNRFRFSTLREVVSLVRRASFNVIHTHGGTAGFWGRVAGIVSGHRPAFVHTYHGMHYLSKDSKCPRWFKTIDRILLKYTSAVICVCSTDYKQGLMAGIVSKDKAILVPNGIEVQKFCGPKRREELRAEFDVDESTIVFGNIGRLHVQKGHEYLLQAFNSVARLYPKTALWLIGDGELRGELTRLTKAFGLTNKVRFLGDRLDIPDLLAAIDVFVLPSLWEGQPISLIEAMISRKPVIASSVDGVADILTEGVNGLLVPPKDSQALADVMGKLIEDSALRSDLAEHAHKTVADGYTATSMAAKVGEIYQDIV